MTSYVANYQSITPALIADRSTLIDIELGKGLTPSEESCSLLESSVEGCIFAKPTEIRTALYISVR